jgi:D-alanine-D-alanine ligase
VAARLRIGLVFELLGTLPAGEELPPDADAEFEPPETIAALEAAVRELGHEPVRLGSPHQLLRGVAAGPSPGLAAGTAPRPDAVWNIAEGYGTRNREAWAPVLLEMAQIPALGSDALTLSSSLDKLWTRQLVAAAGVPVPPGESLESADALKHFVSPAAYPLFVKPRWEGTAKGIDAHSRVEDAAALARQVDAVTSRYQQPALVEAFLPGAEYTVTLIGNDPPERLPVLQRALDPRTGIGWHAVETNAAPGAVPETPGALTPELEAELGELADLAFAALRCRDFARVDFRLDAAGRPFFLEINPLPTFAPDGSFAILAEVMGIPFETLLSRVLALGLQRLGLHEPGRV